MRLREAVAVRLVVRAAPDRRDAHIAGRMPNSSAVDIVTKRANTSALPFTFTVL
jgi:hypothetical protein